jgi:pimeloyl-ACP methyl ester carboxylesterase
MDMSFANNQGVRIYYETVGSGPALVLHHGALGSGTDWADFGYVGVLKEDHQLILVHAWQW